ncbi:RNA polymerase sigma factor [Maricaulis sp.]|nr:RNA polymerase sigma factor [Maricaulis sp.]
MTLKGRPAFRVISSNGPVADDVLIERVGRGDREAARLLMERMLPKILGLAQRMLKDPLEAEDVAQETFIRVWKAADRFEKGRAQVSTWISRIAINLCYDRLRKRREVLTDEVPERADEGISQETAMVRDESANRIVDAVNKLPERQRMAMELVHFQEMSNIKAAEIMSVSVDALESLLARGRRKLKSLLMQDAGDLISAYEGERQAHEELD